ncbi:3555_t:CDS:2 [Funneliformis geosporum]|uniref:3555_t:CDS:1 n=1 Tax=Funneliformis geosporum TaxID=1117311 RepID=A0A9W4SG89_9GLOM|nr:3555_t:CDS:2 [Funneliformis geosporum]
MGDKSISGDADSWTKKDFMKLENRLKDFLPYVILFQIPGDKLYEFVWLFKKILPKKLKAQLTQFHVMLNTELPPLGISYNLLLRLPKHQIDSLYVTSKHAGNVWINKGENGLKNRDKVVFQLLLGGSRDGMDIKTFHDICDNKVAIVFNDEDVNEDCSDSVLSISTTVVVLNNTTKRRFYLLIVVVPYHEYEVFQVINSREEHYVEENEKELSNGLFSASVKNIAAADTFNESDDSKINIGEDTKSFKVKIIV